MNPEIENLHTLLACVRRAKRFKLEFQPDGTNQKLEPIGPWDGAMLDSAGADGELVAWLKEVAIQYLEYKIEQAALKSREKQ